MKTIFERANFNGTYVLESKITFEITNLNHLEFEPRTGLYFAFMSELLGPFTTLTATKQLILANDLMREMGSTN